MMMMMMMVLLLLLMIAVECREKDFPASINQDVPTVRARNDAFRICFNA